MIAHKPPSASASPHPQGVQGKSARRGTTQAIQQQTGRRRTRASLAANALNNRGSEKQGLGVALARNPVGDGLENLSKPAAGTIQKIHYLTGGDGSLFAMYVIDQNNEGKMYYIYTDHTSTSLSTGLGSPNLITDAECNVVQELSYDACCVKLGFCEHSETKPLVEPIPSLREGNRRDPATWQPYTSLASIPSPLIDRGFTFHEHLYPFTLINMLSAAKSRSEAYAGNGRAYDPLVGRFLSADPYIQAPDNPQNLNRYSYCLNNPLRYTDPSGEHPLVFIGLMAMGTYLGGVATNGGELNPLQWDYKDPGTWFGMAVGMLAGYMGAYGITYPGSVELVTGITTPGSAIYLGGNGIDWKVHWTTDAGGEGSLDLSKPVSLDDIIKGSNDRFTLPPSYAFNPNQANYNLQGAPNSYDYDRSLMPNPGVWLPEVTVNWDGNYGSGQLEEGTPFWWGYTDNMKNPLMQSRIMSEGSEVLYYTLAVPFAGIMAGELIGAFSTYNSFTILRFGGKNRLDFSLDRWLLHYHRRGIGPGQGIGRHRPWEFRPAVEKWWELWKRF